MAQILFARHYCCSSGLTLKVPLSYRSEAGSINLHAKNTFIASSTNNAAIILRTESDYMSSKSLLSGGFFSISGALENLSNITI